MDNLRENSASANEMKILKNENKVLRFLNYQLQMDSLNTGRAAKEVN